MSSAIHLIIRPKKYSKALGGKETLLIVWGVKFLKHKTKAELCPELMRSVQGNSSAAFGRGKNALFFGTVAEALHEYCYI